MLYFSAFSLGLLVATAVALPDVLTVDGGSNSTAPPSISPESAMAQTPPKVFYLSVRNPEVKGPPNAIIYPLNGDFYVDLFAQIYCGPQNCTRKEAYSKPTFALFGTGRYNYLTLNTSVPLPYSAFKKAQSVYVHTSGQLRFFDPPQNLNGAGFPFSWEIVNGTNGARDTLRFVGDPKNYSSQKGGPFMLCTQQLGPLGGKPFSVYQVYVATPGFEAIIDASKCKEIEAEVIYSNDGVYQWI